MKILLKKHVFLFGSFIMFCSCNNNSEIKKVSQQEIIKYKNGNTFREGLKIVNKENDSTINKIGIWKYYYPNGLLRNQTELNENGKL